MEKESNRRSAFILLAGALIANGIYLSASHLYPEAAWFFFSLTAALGILGGIKILNSFGSLFPAPLNRTICWVHSLVFEAFAIGFSFLMRPFRYVGLASGKCGLEKGRPILLIHGYLQNATNWIFLQRLLCRRGFGPIYTLNLSHPFRSIADYAELVSQKAMAIAKETERNDLTLIGHSMGGLVSVWYASKVADQGKVGDVITIGSPMGGTKLAAIAIGSNGREMQRGSDFVRQLQEELQQNNRIRFYHIASKADQIVLPYSSALTGLHPEREYLVDDIGHMSLLYSFRVADKIEEWLSPLR
jgi:triacylglycerol lipase